MFYTVYKITNIVNEKYYIGKHQTKELDDNYMGSGKALKVAINKYGIESFKKEVLYIFDNESDMNAKEKELVVINDQTYNLCDGGKGGFSYINRNKLNVAHITTENAKELSRKANEAKLHKAKTDPAWKEEYNKKLSDSRRGNKNHRYGKPASNKGKKLSNEVRERMRLASIKREAERRESGYYLEKYPKKDRNVH